MHDSRELGPVRQGTRSPIEWLVDTWPDRSWLNRLVYAAFAASLLLYWFGPADWTSPLPISVGILWLLCFLGRIGVYAGELLRRPLSDTVEDPD